MPKVSVIIPFYNAENTIQRALESISNQSFSDFECILINNNSSDKSLEIAENWCKKDQRFKLIHEKQQGVMFASNTGANLAKGEYIARMDADDWSFPDRLKLQVNFLNSNNDFGAISGLVEYKKHKENTDGFARYVNWINSVKNYNEIRLKQFIEAPIVNPTAMWRKDLGEKHGLYRKGDFPEDYEMWLRWLEAGVIIEKVDEPVLKWFDSDDRLTRTDEIYSDDAFFKIKSKYLANWLKQNNPFYPKVAVWGASKISRKRTKFIEEEGIEITHFIDIKESRQLDKEVVHYTKIPTDKSWFVLVYMKHLDLRTKIEKFLQNQGYVEGVNYLLVS